MIKEKILGSEYVNGPGNKISSWCTSTRGTVFTGGAESEQSKVSDIPSSNLKANISETEGKNSEQR
jgi:hypothetical protein